MTIRIPHYFDIYESSTAGCEADDTFVHLKMKKSFGLKLAQKAATKLVIYRNGRADSSKLTFYYWEPNKNVPQIITNVAVFLRSCIKPHKRYLVTEEVVAEVEDHWTDKELGLTLPLPPSNNRYPILLNGFYDVLKARFHKYKYEKYNPGYCRFMIHSEYLSSSCSSISVPQFLADCGQLATGFRMKRNLIWCHNNVATYFIQILKAALPDEGAIQELTASAPKPEFHDAAASDSHCLILKISTATVMSATFFSKLQILAKSQKPVLIVTEFKPFIPDGVNIDEAMTLQKSLRIIKNDALNELRNLDLTNHATISEIVTSSLRAMSDLLNSVDGDVSTEADSIFERTDPNNIKEMLKKLCDAAIEDTGDTSDIITVQDLTEKLSAFVNSAGGDGSKISVNGVGKFLNDLKIRKDDVKLPSRKSKVKAIIGYKWKIKI